MKKIVTYVLSAIIVLLLIAVCMTPAYADAEDVGAGETVQETTKEATEESSEPEEEKLLSEQIWDLILKYKDDLLSLAGVIISCVLAYLFRKGLVPMVERIYSDLSEKIGNGTGELSQSSQALNGTLKDVEALLRKVEEYSKLLNDAKTREEATAQLLYQQTEMLYQLISNCDTTVSVQNKATEVYNASLAAIKAMYGNQIGEVTLREEDQ